MVVRRDSALPRNLLLLLLPSVFCRENKATKLPELRRVRLVLLCISTQTTELYRNRMPTCQPACLTWLFTLLIFLSLASGKRRAYLVLILPPFSISLAIILEKILKDIKPKTIQYIPKTIQKTWFIFFSSLFTCYIISKLSIPSLFLSSHKNLITSY